LVDAGGASQAIAASVAAAVNSQGDLSRVVESFYGPDRERFAQALRRNENRNLDNRRLLVAIAQIQESFQGKYNQPLNLAEAGALGNDFARVVGDEGARTAALRQGSGQGSRIERSSGDGRTSTASGRNSGSAGASVSGEGSGQSSSVSSSGKASASASASASGGSTAKSTSSSSEKNTPGTSGTGAGGGGSSSAGPSSTTDTAEAAKPSQGNIGQRQDAAGGTSGSPTVGTRHEITKEISGAGKVEGQSRGTGSASGGTAPGGDLANSTIATIPASHGLPAVAVSLVREGGDWKINVPDTLTPQRLQDNLARHLEMANRQRDQWPADAKDAQQAIAHHVLLAIMDVSDAGGAGAAGAGAGNRR
jgi:hypothetical protein